MAINSYGYPDTLGVDAVILSNWMAGGAGHLYSVFGFADLRVTAATSGTRRANIADGWCTGKAVTVQNTAQATLDLPAPSGSSQWFLVGVKRWTADGPGYISELVYVAGTSDRAVPDVTQTPGTADTQWLALCRVTSADALIQEVVDLRLISTEGAGFYVVNSDLAMEQLEDVVGAEVYRADTTAGHKPTFYQRISGITGTLSWKNLRAPETILTGSAFVAGSAFAGWSQVTAEQRLVAYGDLIWVHVVLQKSGGMVVATSDGSLGDNSNLLTLDSAWYPRNPVSGSAYVTSDASVERNAGVRLNAVGVIQVTSTQPGAAVRTVTADLIYSKA